ncbi:MAG: hypothetical protein NVSMB32_14040 [Actinomycetota bacterium]
MVMRMKTRFSRASAAPALMVLALLPMLGDASLAASRVAWRTPGRASAYPSSTVEIQGHGFGHGRGMGQYGALGYALANTPYSQILDHFYGGTTAGTMANSPITVRLTSFDGAITAVVQEKGHATVQGVAGSFAALRAVPIGANAFRVESSTFCSGPWATVAPSLHGPVVFSPLSATPTASTDRSELLQACLPDGSGTRWLRGSIQSVDSGGGGNLSDQRTVNALPMEAYLLGSISRESPAFWGSLTGPGGATGMDALKAQAVAGRSFAASSNRYSYAQICDTTSCQVYGGRAIQTNGTYTDLEDPRSTAAVLATAGQVRRTAGGAVAHTEYSSSTGGYSAGGDFPSVVDAGDSVAQNSSHSWDVKLPVSLLEAAYPSIGTLQSIQVTSRNGLGDMGGRVLSLSISGSSGSVTDSGNGFAANLGLRSNWFQVVPAAPQLSGGYWMVGTDGGIYSFGTSHFYGSTGSLILNKPMVGMAAAPSGHGYWLVASDGGIFNYGDAAFFGSTGSIALNKPIVGMAATASGHGYWLVASDGGIFNYGSARFFGSQGGSPLNQPIVGIAAAPDSQGYWEVAADGGIFNFGSAAFRGSMGGTPLNKPVVGIAGS